VTLSAAFAQQAQACAALQSPFMERLLMSLAQHWPPGPLDQHLRQLSGDPGPNGLSLPLRLAGGLHALVLRRECPALVAVYPPHSVCDDQLRRAVLEALQSHSQFLIDWTRSAPQTNEVRRSAALIAGANVANFYHDLPIHLSELGASAGLNLMWDRFALCARGQRLGPDTAALTLAPEWQGPPPPAAAPRIASRRGVDLCPIDPQSDEGRLRLMAYLWPDQPGRAARTATAAALTHAPVDRGDAIEWLERRLGTAPKGHLHLIQHTIAWQYFPPDAQIRGKALIETAGQSTTTDSPLAWLSLEADDQSATLGGAALVLRLWPGDLHLPLGRADFHGRWVHWSFARQ
jgi:hypothetical protein